ncbi:MAG: hypothetical protein ABI488_15910 [Polyangiaceae bacterium]
MQVTDATYLLPPQRAALIPAGVKHVTSMGNAQCISLFFERRLLHARLLAVHVLEVTPLLGEMIQYATRWPPSRRVVVVSRWRMRSSAASGYCFKNGSRSRTPTGCPAVAASWCSRPSR